MPKDAGLKLMRVVLQEAPADRERGFQVRLRTVIVGRWGGDPGQLLPYLEEDPARAKLPEAKAAVLGWLSRNYDIDDTEDIEARTMAWKYWSAEIAETLHEWVATGDDRQRLNALMILTEAKELRDEEADSAYAWILLHRDGSDSRQRTAIFSIAKGTLITGDEDIRVAGNR